MWKGRAGLANRNGEEHGSITPYQFITILVGANIGTGVLAFPRLIAEQAGTGAPLATLLGVIPVALAGLAAIKLSRWFPGRSPVEYSPKLLTLPVGWLYSVALLVMKLAMTALAVREFGAVLRTAVLPNTPIEVTITLLLFTTAYFVRHDVQVFARVFEVFFPVMLVPLIIIGLLSLKNARAYYLFPLLGTSWAGLLRGAALASVGYIAYMIALFLLPSLSQPKQAVKAWLTGTALSAFVYMLAVTACLAVFGPEEIKHLIWPTFDLAKNTTVPGFILERPESAFLGIWVAAVFTTVGATYYASLLMISQLFKLRDHKVMAIPLIPVLYVIAMSPPNIHALYRIATGWGLFGVALNVGGPLLMAGIGLLLTKGATQGAAPPE